MVFCSNPSKRILVGGYMYSLVVEFQLTTQLKNDRTVLLQKKIPQSPSYWATEYLSIQQDEQITM